MPYLCFVIYYKSKMGILQKSIITLCVAIFVGTSFSLAQTRQTREEYIAKYKHIAIEHMERYGIPASITMAQGILESDSGNSALAKNSNNHFGIKCKSNWSGRKVFHDDDEKGECFRAYDSVEESYTDHADFLDQSPRYDSLFAYAATDYRSWARGLKAAGYATAPDYAQRLVKIIEDNQLYLLDKDNGGELYASHLKAEQQLNDSFAEKSNVDMPETKEGGIDPNNYRVAERTYNGYSVYANNRTHYVVARNGDKFKDIASTFGLTERTLRKYNELDPKSTCEPIMGEPIYIERKQAKWLGNIHRHKVKQGETLLSLSQEYAIRLKRLAAMNKKHPDAALQAGEDIKLK